MTFSELALYFQKLEKTPSRITMTEILADLFRRAGSDEIGEICYLLQGRVAPLYEPIEFGIAEKLMIRAIASGVYVGEGDVFSVFKKEGDLGAAAEFFVAKRNGKTGSKKKSVKEIFRMLKDIAVLGGVGSQEKKIALLSGLFGSLDSLSARYIARIPLGKLRLGFSDKTMLDALSWMMSNNKSKREVLESAYDVRPDIAYIAATVKEHGIGGVSHVHAVVGAPILPALCQRLPNAVEMIKKMGEVNVEPKYDGVRTQIHFMRLKSKDKGLKIHAYSRNLENTTAMYPELLHISSQIDADNVILDCEAVGYDPKSDRIIPFQETVTRKRKHNVENISKSVPLRFFAFDILHKDGKDLMDKPLSLRRNILEQTIRKGDVISISPHIVISDVETLRQYHDEQLQKGLEGAVVKKWDSPYVPGRRGFHWVKFKEEDGKTGKLSDTIDCVVMGYYRGKGKRSAFGIGAFLAGVAKGDGFVTLTKIGTGVSDELWKSLYSLFDSHTVKEKPKEYGVVEKILIPDYWIEPEVVVEIAADDITVSPIHTAGFALRFPRLVHIRSDKRAGDITRVSEIERMYKNQSSIRK